MDRADLERLDRESLVLRAQAAGIRRARVLTRPELVDELLRLDPLIDEAQLKKTRGFFGRARDLLSRVVERGLHLPDAADRLRAALGNPLPQVPRPEPQAVPTVTLAEIYAAQGHKQRAIETLRRVLDAEPDHRTARTLLEKLEAADYVAPPRPLPPENEVESPAQDADDEEVDEIGANLGTSPTEPPPPAPAIAEAVAAVAVAESEPYPHFDEPVTIPNVAAAVEPLSLPDHSIPPPGSREVTQNECVALPVGRDGSYVWWRLTPATRRRIEEQRFVVRALVVMPSWDGPKQATRDVACEPIEGELLLRGLPENAVVRIAVGWLDADANVFVPLAHSPPLVWLKDNNSNNNAAARNEGERAKLVRWTLSGTEHVVLDDPNASSIASAAEGAARAGLHVGPGS